MMLARPGVARFVARRLVQAVPTILVIIVVSFLVLQLTPGDIVDVLAGEAGAATPEYVAMLRQRFGLDRPLITQLASYVWGVVNLDLGFSFRHNTTVLRLMLDRLPATLILMGTSLSVAVALGVVFGVTAARHVNRPTDGAIAVLVLLSYATPTFWIGLMLIVLFSVKLGWLPTGGMMTIGAGLSGFGRVLDVAHHLVLPAASLALFYAAIYTRLMRASMLEVSGQDYVRTARAKGISEARVMYGHALRNALLRCHHGRLRWLPPRGSCSSECLRWRASPPRLRGGASARLQLLLGISHGALGDRGHLVIVCSTRC